MKVTNKKIFSSTTNSSFDQKVKTERTERVNMIDHTHMNTYTWALQPIPSNPFRDTCKAAQNVTTQQIILDHSITELKSNTATNTSGRSVSSMYPWVCLCVSMCTCRCGVCVNVSVGASLCVSVTWCTNQYDWDDPTPPGWPRAVGRKWDR